MPTMSFQQFALLVANDTNGDHKIGNVLRLPVEPLVETTVPFATMVILVESMSPMVPLVGPMAQMVSLLKCLSI